MSCKHRIRLVWSVYLEVARTLCAHVRLSRSARGFVHSVVMTGIYRADSVRDVADSLGLHNIGENVVSLLASDVEYRLHQVIEEASRFTRHAKRTTLTTADIDQAFRVLNIEVSTNCSPIPFYEVDVVCG
jgi:histone H3/H4